MALRRPKLTYAGRIVRPVVRGRVTAPPAQLSRNLRVPRAQVRKHRRQTRKVALNVPSSTYRFQFHGEFKFSDAGALVDYLQALGISHSYASPISAARQGSTHGYDTCSFEKVSDAAGGEKLFRQMARRFSSAGVSLVLDIVPNHMATHCANQWWNGVLENGLHSPYARWFDIDWECPHLRGKILLPVLENELDAVLNAGKLKLTHRGGHFVIQYYDRDFPLSPESARQLAHEAATIGHEKLLAAYNSTHHPERMRSLLGKQHYTLAYWRHAAEKINYRRFFDVSDLVCMRTELPEVFEAIHRLPLQLIKEGFVTGLRVDHPDGLWDPTTYFHRLQRSASHACGTRQPFYIVAEKILTRDEQLPPDWPVAGTTGYDYLNRLNGLFVDSSSEQVFSRLHQEITGNSADFEEVLRMGKRTVLSTAFRSELSRLSRELKPLLETDQFTLDGVREALRAVVVNFPVYRTYLSEQTARPTPFEAQCINHAIAEALARRPEIDGEILRLLRSILLLAHPKSQQPKFRDFVMRFQQLTGPAMAKGMEDTAFYNYTRLISLNEVGGDPGKFGVSVREFHQHNQRAASTWPHTLCATATHDTKRGEDARARINVLSEYPNEWREAVLRWRKINADKRTKLRGGWAPSGSDEYLFYQTLIGVWPFAKKYSVFSPEGIRGYSEPDLLLLRERVLAYMLKAVKEAKQQTSWLEPNEEYETAVNNFVAAALDEEISGRFLSDFEAFHQNVSHFGWLNSLSQVLLKTMSPGVPDIYQGCELWDFSMVDPDNRRPVDFELRQKLLRRLQSSSAESSNSSHLLADLLKKPESGAVKMYVLWRALNSRQQFRDIFDRGKYLPLEVEGTHADHVVSFARCEGKQRVIAVAPGLIAGLCKKKRIVPLGEAVWGETRIRLDTRTAKRFTNLMTGGKSLEAHSGTLRLADILADFPVAILKTE